ncbi:MAG: tetratricopeptide repeat protein [Candidatus Omnitrophica bacterium]|nr:tetratricopeptide repeat protein [Candidatus Omnitrophota bacterium]
MYNKFNKAMLKAHQNIIKSLLVITIILFGARVVFAQSIPAQKLSNKESAPAQKAPQVNAKEEEKGYTELQKTARNYREQGMSAQHIGNIQTAEQFYQKAIEIDPNYAVPYNDLGVLLEAQGQGARAEQSYLKAVQVDPNYLSAYSNLAIFYETKRDLNKAAFYWDKRAKLGDPSDPWTIKAKQRLADMNLVLSPTPVEDLREQEIVSLTKDIVNKKDILSKSDSAQAREHFAKAKRSYELGDYGTALKKAIDAQQLDPNNQEISNFIDEVRTRALTK